MPTQDRIRSEQRAEQFELPASKNLSFNGESSPLVVTEQDAFLAELLFKYGVRHSRFADTQSLPVAGD